MMVFERLPKTYERIFCNIFHGWGTATAYKKYFSHTLAENRHDHRGLTKDILHYTPWVRSTVGPI